MPSPPQPPDAITGTAVLDARDTRTVMRAVAKPFGAFVQVRVFLYCSVVAMVAAWFALGGLRALAIAALAVAVLLYVAGAFAGVRTQRIARSRFARQEQERRIVVTDDTLSLFEDEMTVTYTWPRFDDGYESPEAFVLLTGPGMVLVPKRAFTPGDLERVRATITSHVALKPL